MAIRNISETRPHGLSAFVRCRNEEEFIVPSLLSVYRFCDEIVVILNNSTDGTRQLVEDLMVDHPRISLLNYDFECAPPGPDYAREVAEDSTRSLARYYNWCLSQTRFSHVCKWDGDMIAIAPFGEARDLIASNDVVILDGFDVVGQPTVSPEPRIFRFDLEHTRYVDWDLYEILKYDYTSEAQVPDKCYVHMKLVKKEWLHKEWVTPNVFAVRPYPSPRDPVAHEVSRTSRFLRWLRR